MSSPLRLEFVASATDVEQLPETETEVAVVGRSNVGKSSLINSLANRKALARVAKAPGRTRLLNLFAAGEGGFVDCPGYGYAAVSGAERNAWRDMIEGYLLRRESLVMIMVLVDGEVGPTKLDVQMLEWLRFHELAHTVIATKHDKVKASKRDKRKRDLAAGCELKPNQIVWVSAHSGVGIDRLRGLIGGWLAGESGETGTPLDKN